MSGSVVCPVCHSPVPGYVSVNGATRHLFKSVHGYFELGEICPAAASEKGTPDAH